MTKDVLKNLKQRKDYTLFILKIYRSRRECIKIVCWWRKTGNNFSAYKLSLDLARFTYMLRVS